jgi:ABC-type antimicrobial peptide transport system permease subunit
MKMDEMTRMAFENLWKTKLRTGLTVLGVVIGIGALVSMVSFGTGMQKNITEAFLQNDLFTSMQVLPRKINIEEAMSGNPQALIKEARKDSVKLDQAALNKIRSVPEVEIAFPEIRFPVKVRFQDREAVTNLRALPAVMGKFKPLNNLAAGVFYSNDSQKVAILSPRLLRDLKFRLIDPSNPKKTTIEDTLKGFRSVRADSLVGRNLELVTSVLDFGKVMRNPMAAAGRGGSPGLPFSEKTSHFRIAGIARQASGFEQGFFESGLILPMKAAESLPRFNFSSAWDILNGKAASGAYSSLYVRVKKMEHLAPVKKRIEDMGYGVISIADQLEDFKKGFLIFDTLLGAVGTIALLVAALGIINTMVMSILERTREIGIMKAVGGGESDIRGIFFVEAGVIGFVGGVFGLGLGWLVTRIANVIANLVVAKQGGPHMDFFYIPLWLILGAMAFSICVSLLAGLYPAMRASRVNPVEALRHD